MNWTTAPPVYIALRLFRQRATATVLVKILPGALVFTVAVFATPHANASGKSRVHDNVFVHGGVTLGPSWLRYDAPMNTGTRHEGSSFDFGPGIEAAMGGTIPGGVVVAGLIRMNIQADPSFDDPTVMRGWDRGTNFVGTYGALVRYYPVPTRGFFADGFVGVGFHHTHHEVVFDLFPRSCPMIDPQCDERPHFATPFTADERSRGVMFGVGGGYEFWIGKNWSLGPGGRIEYARTWSSRGTYTFISPTFLFSLTYN